MRTIRTGTVVWSLVLLVFAAVAFGVAVFDLREFQAAALAWIVTALGGVFVLAAAVALIVRAVRPAAPVAEPEPPVVEAEPSVVEPVETIAEKRKRTTKDQPTG